VTSLDSVGVLRPAPRPIARDDLVPDCHWRAVCEYPGATPAQMAVQAGRAALAAAHARADQVQWLLHAGVGPQGSQGWPVHHHIQNGIVGCHGNALEMKQNCAGGLTSWLFASRLLDTAGYSICTGADNWSWSDRFANCRTIGGEPFSDVAYATVISHSGGFAKLLGSGTASCPGLADDWRVHETFWESTNAGGFHAAYARATASRSDESMRESFRMFACATKAALSDARVSPQYVTHFVPQGSDSGQPFRLLAKVIGLPWSPELHQHNLDHGYLGVSTHADGLVYLAQTHSLRADSIVLLLAAEYQLSATAIILRVIRPPRVSADGMTQVIA
jgi:3-oxoacyl-[acyl-carrier-protein] synthase III